MSPVRTIFAGAIALAVVACTDAPVAIETDLEPQLARGGPLVHLATGSGIAFSAGGTVHRIFSFTAREHADGRVSGQFQLELIGPPDFGSTNPAITRYLQAEVTCLSVDPNFPLFGGFPTAWVAGVIKSSSVPAHIGEAAAFAVVDRREGNSGPFDIITTMVPFPIGSNTVAEVNAFCETQDLLPAQGGIAIRLLDVGQGNIQVR